MSESAPAGRRSLLGWFAALPAVLPFAAALAVALRAALAPARRRGGARVPLLPLAEIPEDRFVSRRIAWVRTVGAFREEVERVVFVRRSGRRVLALSSRCTHLGCPVRLHDAGRSLRCPCHGGRFDLEGRVVAGPPPRPLRRYRVEVPKDPRAPVVLLAGGEPA